MRTTSGRSDRVSFEGCRTIHFSFPEGRNSSTRVIPAEIPPARGVTCSILPSRLSFFNTLRINPESIIAESDDFVEFPGELAQVLQLTNVIGIVEVQEENPPAQSGGALTNGDFL